jgi:predicted nuclease of predicted toxin-antitoxin system
LKVRLFTDENIPVSSVRVLRAMGIEVFYASEICPGASDNRVMEMARLESCILLTFDRDFGQLLFKAGHAAPFGVIYFRFVPSHPEEVAEVVKGLINDSITLDGMFTVCERESIRQRPLLSSAS